MATFWWNVVRMFKAWELKGAVSGRRRERLDDTLYKDGDYIQGGDSVGLVVGGCCFCCLPFEFQWALDWDKCTTLDDLTRLDITGWPHNGP